MVGPREAVLMHSRRPVWGQTGSLFHTDAVEATPMRIMTALNSLQGARRVEHALAHIIFGFAALWGAALDLGVRGGHGLSEVVCTYTSRTVSNGPPFASLNVSTRFFNSPWALPCRAVWGVHAVAVPTSSPGRPSVPCRARAILHQPAGSVGAVTGRRRIPQRG
jgi:hypothetical protein